MSKPAPSVKLPLVLALILCLGGGLVYWLEYSKKPKDAALEADRKKLFLLKDEPILKIEIEGASKKPEHAKRPPLKLILECLSQNDQLCKSEDTSKWKMVAPIETRGDDSTINSLLKNFSNLTISEKIDLSQDSAEKKAELLSAYALDEKSRVRPEAQKLTFALKSGKRWTAYFGGTSPVGSSVYALLSEGDRVNEATVYLVPDWQLSVFDQKVSYFRDKKLFSLNEQDVKSLKILKSKKLSQSIEAIKEADQKGWKIKAGPRSYVGDPDTLDSIVTGTLFLSAKDIVSENKKTKEALQELKGAQATYHGILQTQAASIEIRLFEKKKSKDAQPTIYAQVDGQDPLFELDSYSVEKIEKTLDELRLSKLVSVTERYSITHLSLEKKGEGAFQQTLAKESGDWKVNGSSAVKGRVDALLDRLTTKSVSKFSGPRSNGKDSLYLKLSKKVEGKDVTVGNFEFWVERGHLYAKNLDDSLSETIEIVPEAYAELPWDARFLTMEGFQPDTTRVTTKPSVQRAPPGDGHEHDSHGHP